MLDHAGLIQNACFLDLFCGTGAIGLEAWSRGAATVWLIDQDTDLARKNVDAVRKPEGIHIQRADASRLGQAPCRFDVVFLDPPYRSGLATPAIAGLLRGWLTAEAMVVLELAAKEAFDPPTGFALVDSRQYGAARILFLKGTDVRHDADPS